MSIRLALLALLVAGCAHMGTLQSVRRARQEPDGVHLIGRAAPSAGVVLLGTSR
jgi:hypothetical protein